MSEIYPETGIPDEGECLVFGPVAFLGCQRRDHAEVALMRITGLALNDTGLRAEWEHAVQSAADQQAGYLAGMRMAGRNTAGVIPGLQVLIPFPDGMREMDVIAAFRLALGGEMGRRLAKMTERPPGGIG